MNKQIANSGLLKAEKWGNQYFIYNKTINGKNGRYVGTVYREIDGFYVFESPTGRGYWASHYLRWLADYLDAMNEEWINLLNTELNNDHETYF